MTRSIHFVPAEELQRVRSANLGPVEKTRLFASLCRLNALSMIAWAGSGHIGSSFSSIDVVSWLFLNEMRHGSGKPGDDGSDVYFSSKGHDAPGFYSVLIGCGLLPEDGLRSLRRLEGLPGHPDVGTPQIATNTGSLGMGVAKAKGMIFANRLRGRDQRFYVMTGDGELQEGQFWESLSSAANDGLGELTVIIDHNKYQSDGKVSETSDLGNLEAKLAAFGWHVSRCDGNDPAALSDVFAQHSAVTDRPKVVIADTVKGSGVSFMEATAMAPDEWRYLYHSGAASPDDYAAACEELIAGFGAAATALKVDPVRVESMELPDAPAAPVTQRLVNAYSEALLAQAEVNSDIVALDADLILDTGLIPFRERFPERFVECGIAEQDMVSQAGGMALSGLLPVVHSFACFLSTRPNEQIYNNATEHTRIVYVASLAGVLPAGPGHSHQSVRDISILGSIPGLVMMQPACEREVAACVEFCLARNPSSSYLRLVSIPCEIPFELGADYRLELGRGTVLKDGGDAVMFAYGPVMLAQAWHACEQLRQHKGLHVKLIDLPWLNRVDVDWLCSVVEGVGHVFTVDDHYSSGGQGEMIGAALAEGGLASATSLTRFGLHEVPQCGRNDEVLRAHGLDAETLADRISGVMSA